MKRLLLTALLFSSLLAAQDSSYPQKKIQRSTLPRYIPEEPKTSKFLFSGDLLYWIPEMDGLVYARETYMVKRQTFDPNDQTLKTVSQPESSPLEVIGNWQPGVRLSLGYLFDEKGWDALINWSYFKNEPSHRAIAIERVSPAILPPSYSFGTTMDEARGKWYLLQHTLDFELGRNFPVGKAFLARPFVGLSGTSIHNKNVFHYSMTSQDHSFSIEFPMKSNFLGLGPRIGGNLAYEFGKGIGIFALGSGSVMMGTFENSFDGVSHSPRSMRAITSMQIQMGFQWKKRILDKYFVGLKTAWEQNFYNGVNRSVRQIARTQNTPRLRESGDLILKGLTASCHLDF